MIPQTEPLIGEAEKQAVMNYLDSGGWLTEYKYTREFERIIADYVGIRHASVLCNGTLSLVAALMAAGITRGDEVIVPDFTMIASANAVVFTGGKPVLVDVDPENLCLDLDKAEDALNPRTKAVIYVSINGRCGDMKKLMSLTRRHNLFLIEDAAQSLGSRYSDKPLGTFGDLGIYSFSHPKIITTGQGGAVVTDSDELYRRVLLVKDFGRPRGGVDYHTHLGLNFKFTDLQAVIGIEQMRKIEWRVRRKKEIYRIYSEALDPIPEIGLLKTELKEATPWFMDIIVDDREELSQYLKEEGVGTRPFYPAIHTQQPYAGNLGVFKNSEQASQKGLWLPSSLTLKDDDIEYVCNKIKEHYGR